VTDWYNPDELLQTAATEARAADFNKVVENLRFLHATPQVAVRLTSTQSVADATTHTITWDEAVWDATGGTMWNSGASSKIVIPRAGVYSVVCACLYAAADDNTKRSVFLHVNSNATARRGLQVPAVDPSEIILAADTNLAANDELDFRVRQLSGAALNLEPTRTVATVRWVGAPPTV
jgi:plastocyanin